jgi:ABC-type multidrug transport system ATPase subunit
VEDRRRRVRELLERFHLGPDAGRPMSRGGPVVAQKVALAAALLTEPEVLLLDDPLRALDLQDRKLLLDLPGRRTTVLLASRYPTTEEGLVNQVALIRDGRLALHARIEDLAASSLPLSLRGIEALAAARVAGGATVPRTPAAAAHAAPR